MMGPGRTGMMDVIHDQPKQRASRGPQSALMISLPSTVRGLLATRAFPHYVALGATEANGDFVKSLRRREGMRAQDERPRACGH